MSQTDDQIQREESDLCLAPTHLLRHWHAVVASTWKELDESSQDQYAAVLKASRSNSTHGAALQLLQDFIQRVDLGLPQDDETLRFIAEAISRIIDYKDPLHSLGLLPREKKRPPAPEKALLIARWVFLAEHLRGCTRGEAVALAAEQWHRAERSVERYLAQTEGQAFRPDESWVDRYALLGRPLPAKKRPP